MNKELPLYGFGGGGGGGSASLNFEVKTYESEDALPESTKENTVAVITDTPITAYTFSAEAPAEPVEGMAWFMLGDSSPAAFSLTEKNPIMLYPLSAMQYIGGAWVSVTAKSYIGGEWVEWIKWDVLYDEGNQNVTLTGGWTCTSAELSSGTGKGTGGITEGADSITFKNTKTGGAIYHTVNKIDLTGYSTVVFDGKMTRNNSGNVLYFCVWSEIGSTFTSNRVVNLKVESDQNGQVTLDISGVTAGKYYVGFGLHTTSPEVIMRSLKLE